MNEEDINELIYDLLTTDIDYTERGFNAFLYDIVTSLGECGGMDQFLLNSLNDKLSKIMGTNIENITYRDKTCFLTRKSYLITKSFLVTKEKTTPLDIGKIPQEFFYIVKNTPDICTIWELRTLMINFRMQMHQFKFSSHIISLLESVSKRILWFVSHKGDPMREMYFYDTPLLVQYFDKDNDVEVEKSSSLGNVYLSVSDSFFEISERFIYWMERKKYFSREIFYVERDFEIKNQLFKNILSIISLYLDKSGNIKNLDKQVIKRIPDWLVLESEIEAYRKLVGERTIITSVDVLKRFRNPAISYYWRFIRDEVGIAEWLAEKVKFDEFMKYLRSNRTDPVIERTLVCIIENLFLYETKVRLENFIILEKDIKIPFEKNAFVNEHIPYIVQTWRGWCVWLYDEKKMLPFSSFMEAFIIFLVVLKFLALSERSDCCSSVQHSIIFSNLKTITNCSLFTKTFQE